LYPDPNITGQPTQNPFELTSTPQVLIPVTGGGGNKVAWSPSGKWIIIPSNHGVFIFDASTLLLNRFSNPDQSFLDAAYGLHDNLVVMVDGEYTAISRDVDADQQVERRDIVEIDQISGLCSPGKVETYPDNLWLVCLDKKGVADLNNVRNKFYKTRRLILPPEAISSNGSVWAIAYNNNGHVIAEVYDIAKGTRINQFTTPRGVKMVWRPDFSVALSSNGEMVAIADYADHVTVWNTRTQAELYDCKADFPIQHMGFSPNNQRLALIDDKNHVVLELTGQGCQITYPEPL